jgi:uncharacterized damage-inducible protein DinB
MRRPEPDEYAPYYADYIDMVKGSDITFILAGQVFLVEKLLSEISEDKANSSYAPGKWTIKEVMGHLIDCERIFAYRALCISRGETKPLPGFDQDIYVQNAGFNQRTMTSLLEEYALLRNSNIACFKSFTRDMLHFKGVANNYPISVNALMYCIAGHELHHMKVLQERYLS